MLADDFDIRKRIDDTPAKICGGNVFDIGGRDHVLVRGAGVDSILHTVRIEVIAQPGASGIIVELERPLGRIFSDLCGVGREGEVVLLMDRFSGVDLLGVFWSPRGVVVGFDGVRVVLDSFVGVDGPDPERVGVPGAEPLADRLTDVVLDVKDRSRKPCSFL